MSSRSLQLLAFALAAVTAAACTVVVEQPRPVSPRPLACTFEYAPVCGRRGNQQRSFSNACQARASGFVVVHRGQCRVGSLPNMRPPVACTRTFAPVCAVRGNNARTFQNACVARANGFRPIRSGRCR